MKIILSGPSGAGKDTLIDLWINKNPQVKRVITATTRSPRPGEIDGVSYYFYTVEEMETKIANGDFLEHMNVFGNIYGTPKSSVDEIEVEGGIAIIRVDVQGAIDLLPKMPDATSVFILPPSLEELKRRITNRKTETAEVLDERMYTAIAEIMCSYFYDNQIVNDNADEAVSQLEAMVNGYSFINTKLADECMMMTLDSRTIVRIEAFLEMAEKSGISRKSSKSA